jgi:hypothetical protein
MAVIRITLIVHFSTSGSLMMHYVMPSHSLMVPIFYRLTRSSPTLRYGAHATAVSFPLSEGPHNALASCSFKDAVMPRKLTYGANQKSNFVLG